MLAELELDLPRRRPPYGIYAYTGREWDPEIGLYYYRARYYDPKAGRFISEDPIRFLAGPNFYAYVRNNPLRWTDPTGLQGTNPASVCAVSTFSFWWSLSYCQVLWIGGDAQAACPFPPSSFSRS